MFKLPYSPRPNRADNGLTSVKKLATLFILNKVKRFWTVGVCICPGGNTQDVLTYPISNPLPTPQIIRSLNSFPGPLEIISLNEKYSSRRCTTFF